MDDLEIRCVRKEDIESFVNVYMESYRGLESYAYKSKRLVRFYFK